MSLILEALRKSEAERRRGQPPDLHAERAPATQRVARRVPAWVWLASSIVVLLLAAWLWSQRSNSVEATTAANRDAIKAPAADSPRDRMPAATPSLPARTPAPPTVAEPAPPEPRTPPNRPAEPAPATVQTPPSTPATPPSIQPPRPPAAAQPRPVPAPPAADGRVLTLAELDPDTRRALPPLKLSMHLWNEVPAQRFVILDGQRMTEGDRVGAASIVRIERDGVLLDWQGRGIRIPVP